MSDERSFLHDIASPIAAGSFCLEMLMDDLKVGTVVDEASIEVLKKITESLDTAAKRLKERREILISREKA
jgi:hypothetical protein